MANDLLPDLPGLKLLDRGDQVKAVTDIFVNALRSLGYENGVVLLAFDENPSQVTVISQRFDGIESGLQDEYELGVYIGACRLMDVEPEPDLACPVMPAKKAS